MQTSNPEYIVLQMALNIAEPWTIMDVRVNNEEKIMDIYLNFKRGTKFTCSHCGYQNAKVHDIVHPDRTWRHLNFWENKTILHARIPRTKCESCNRILTIHVDWSRPGSRFTKLFELKLKQMMNEMPVAAVARLIDEQDTRLRRIFHL